MSKARYYQRRAIARGDFALQEVNSTLIAIGTGGGKTFIGSKLVQWWLPGKTLWLADQDELCTQPRVSISRFGGIIPALEKSSVHASKQAKVVVGSSQTLCKKARREEYPKDFFDYVIVDEAHRGLARDMEIARYFEKAKILGLTATPFRKDLRDLSEYYEQTAFTFPLRDPQGNNGLIQQGFAPTMSHLILPVEIDLSGVKDSNIAGEKDFNATDLDKKVTPYYREICRLLMEHAAKRKIIVFLPLIKSSQEFVQVARESGFTAYHIDSKSEDREELILGFSQGRFQMLCNAGVVSTGVDIPPADCYVNLRPTKSFAWYQQSVGRVARPLPGVIDDLTEEDQAEERKKRIAESEKPDFLIVDFLYQHDALCMHAGHLIADNEDDARRIFDKSKIGQVQSSEVIAEKVKAEREKAMIKRLEHAANKIKTFTPEVISLITGDHQIGAYDPINAWELKEPWPGQIEKLQKWGVDTTGINRGMAHLLIERMVYRFQHNLATLKQLRAMHNIGLEGYQILNINEAKRVLDAAFKVPERDRPPLIK